MNTQSDRLQSYLQQIEQNAESRDPSPMLPDDDLELRALLQLAQDLKHAPHPTLITASAPDAHQRLVDALHTQRRSSQPGAPTRRPRWQFPWTLRLAGAAAMLGLVALALWSGGDRQKWGAMIGSVHVNAPTATYSPIAVTATSAPSLAPISPPARVVSPLPTPKPDAEIDDRCALTITRHPAAQRLATQYGTSEAAIMAWFCAGYGFGEIGLAHEISLASGATLEEILVLRQVGSDWGAIMQQLEVIMRIDPTEDNLEAEQETE